LEKKLGEYGRPTYATGQRVKTSSKKSKIAKQGKFLYRFFYSVCFREKEKGNEISEKVKKPSKPSGILGEITGGGVK